MERVRHLLNVMELFKTVGCASDNLMTHYVEQCRILSNVVGLPKKIFSPSVMCSHCGSTWSEVPHRTRVRPSRVPSKSILRMIRKAQESGVAAPRSRRTLIKKCLSNRNNKIAFRCSVCSRDTKIEMKKQTLLKSVIAKESLATVLQSAKKKKRTKDRTAGLIIPGMMKPQLQSSGKKRSFTAKREKSKKVVKTFTPQPKSKKANKSKLQNMVNKNTMKKSTLQSFLKELC